MPPQTVSHFELMEKLGEGGMGAVYRARDTRLDRIVALKFLTSKLVDSPHEQQRLRQEARVLSTLNHPHIATVFEVDEMDGAPFVALEYLPGGTLRSRIVEAGGRLPVSTIVAWGADLADGLAHAHRNGVVHRDVKSVNVMFDREGRVKLTDFGLARSTGSREGGESGRMAGTISYMAPEAFEGKSVDPRSDLFSFGVLLYEMATGHVPFHEKDSVELIRHILSDRPRPVTQLRPDLPAGFEKIVNRLVEKRPEDRYGRAEDVAHDLRSLTKPASEEAPTLTAVVQPVRWWTRLSRRWGLLAFAGLMLILLLGNPSALQRWIWRLRAPGQKHVAVLPFRSIGGDTSQEAFCDGITETLTTALTKHGGFSVVPSADARKVDSAAAARIEFGVNLVIYGSVQRRGDVVRVNISFIDAAGGRQIEAEPVNWPVAKLPELEDAILAKISEMLNVTAVEPPSVLAAGASQLPSAYDAYLRGRGYLYRHDKAGNLDRARQQFETAIRHDARFALAYVGLADAQILNYGRRQDPVHLEAARAAAARAVELNPQYAGGHVSMGAILVELGQPERGSTELELALKLDPRDPAAYRALANLHRSQKRFSEAEQVYLRAIATRPGDWLGYSNLGVMYLSRQRYEDAERMYRKVIELTPDNHIGYRLLGTTLHYLGRNPRDAEKMLRRAISLKPTGRSYSNLGTVLMLERRYRDAVPVMQRAVELTAQETPGDFKPYGNLGDAFHLAGGSPERARQSWRMALGIVEKRLKSNQDDPELVAFRALYRAKAGDTAAALQDAERAAILAPDNATARYVLAKVFAVAGSKARALEEIGAAVRSGIPGAEIRRTPEFSAYHGDPAFEQLLTRPAPL